MIITLGGDPGSGKSVIGKAISDKLNLKQYSAGGFMRQIAEERGMPLEKLLKIAESDFSIDTEVDDMVKELAKKEDNFLLDSRIAFHFIPKAIKVFLKTDTKKAAERIWRDIQNKKRQTEAHFKSLEEVHQSVIARQESEKARYKKYYNLNHLDMSNYDIVIDATNMSVQEEIDSLLKAISDFQAKNKN
jgi:cytidylate kinase